MLKQQFINLFKLLKSDIFKNSAEKINTTQHYNYLLGVRQEIQIFNLNYTFVFLRQMVVFLNNYLTPTSRILFIGNSEDTSSYIFKKFICSYNQFYIFSPWVGGVLTNLKNVRKFLIKTKELDSEHSKKLNLFFEGIQKMTFLPNLIVLLNVSNSEILNEIRILGIPCIAFSHQHISLNYSTYYIPGNFTSLKSSLFLCEIFQLCFQLKFKKFN